MELNRMIDHTLLKANATRAQIEKLCDEALEYNFASVCVNTCWVLWRMRSLPTATLRRAASSASPSVPC